MLNSTQIISNLRRTADKGLISLLNQRQLEILALKYFGVKDEYGNYVAYTCPYSGKTFSNFNNLILEHIIPVSSNGGTVLFNCIPASKEINGSNEKGAKHLIEWWTNSKYWDDDAPNRLEKLVNYMLEAYSEVFNEYSYEELVESYLNILDDNDDFIEDINDDLSFSKQNEQIIENEQTKNNKIYSYLSFLNDCIEQLEKSNINVDNINQKLKELQDKKIFENIEEYTKAQNIVKEIITKIIGTDNKVYLTYCLNININKLIKSISYTNEQEIYKEIVLRLDNINTILNNNGLNILDYFKNLMDIEDIDLLYKNRNEITQEQITEFTESISLGYDSKIMIFIDMLNHGNMDILKQKTKEKITAYKKDKKGNTLIDENGKFIINKTYENNGKDSLKVLEVVFLDSFFVKP